MKTETSQNPKFDGIFLKRNQFDGRNEELILHRIAVEFERKKMKNKDFDDERT